MTDKVSIRQLQTSVPGLYVTSMAAGGDFGPSFGCTVSVRAAARTVGDHLARSAGAAL